MSDKRSYEDKAGESPPPRSLTNLLSVTSELRQAVQRQRVEQVRSLLEDLDSAWRQAQQENISVHSRRGDAPMCVAFATALNDANTALFLAQSLLMR